MITKHSRASLTRRMAASVLKCFGEVRRRWSDSTGRVKERDWVTRPGAAVAAGGGAGSSSNGVSLAMLGEGVVAEANPPRPRARRLRPSPSLPLPDRPCPASLWARSS